MPVSVPSVLGTQSQPPAPTIAPAPAPDTTQPVVEEKDGQEEPGLIGGLLNNLIGGTEETTPPVPATQAPPETTAPIVPMAPSAPVPPPGSQALPGQVAGQVPDALPGPGAPPEPGALPVPGTLPGTESQAQATETGGFLSNLFGESPPEPVAPTEQQQPQPQPLSQPVSTGFTPTPVSYTFQTPTPIQQDLETSNLLPTAQIQPQVQTQTTDGRDYDLDIGDADEFLPDEEAEPLEDITFIDDQPPVLSTSVLPEQQQQASRIGTVAAAGIMGGAIDKIMRGEIYEGQPPLESWSDLLPMWAWALIFFLLGAAFVGILYALTRPMEPEPQPAPLPPQPLPPQPTPLPPQPQPQPLPPANRKIYCLIGEDEGRRVVVRVSDASLCRRTVLLTDEEYENSL
jgi:hypothetical protein